MLSKQAYLELVVWMNGLKLLWTLQTLTNTVKHYISVEAFEKVLFLFNLKDYKCVFLLSSRLWRLHSVHVSGLPQGVRALSSGESSNIHCSNIYVCESVCCLKANIPVSPVFLLPLRT